ncbi:MAG: dienelactone hydrolase family protein, partial [Armatimonadetes bacterium]|nr:dienelactone hydrolase family protein [Armatimonadota bacterium]
MKNALLLVMIACLVGCTGGGGEQPEEREGGLHLKAEDGTTVFAELHPVDGEAKGVILMFHQAGSNMHEYDPITPRVVELGYDCLTVDQRAGGDMWNSVNRTAAQFSAEQSYSDAYPDLEAALAWAEGEEYETILAWGSSYSASLVLRLAAENGSVDGVLSFSPGEYFDSEGLVAEWNSEVGVPCLFAATPQELVAGVY